MRQAILTVVLLCPTLLACNESTVPADQVILLLATVDGKTLPTALDAVSGSTVIVQDGHLVGSGASTTCQFLMRYTSGSSLSSANATVPDCSTTNATTLTVRVDLSSVSPVPGNHVYVFARRLNNL